MRKPALGFARKWSRVGRAGVSGWLCARCGGEAAVLACRAGQTGGGMPLETAFSGLFAVCESRRLAFRYVLPFFGVAFSCSLCLQKLLPAWRSGAAMQVSPFASPRVCDSVACAVLLAFSAQNEAKKCVHGRQCAGFLLPLQAVNRVRAKKPRLHPHRRYAHCAPCAQSPRHRGGWSACITSIKKTRKWKRQKDKSVCCSCCSAYCFAFAS